MITQETYAKRREAFFKKMQLNSIAILAASPIRLRNHDVEYPYRQNSNLLYLTGFSEPESMMVLTKDKAGNQFILFSLMQNPEVEQWGGKRIGQKGAIEKFHADKAYPIDEIDQHMPDFLQNKQCAYVAYGSDPIFDQRFFGWLNLAHSQPRSAVNIPCQLVNIESVIHEMRLIKEEREIDLMRGASDINVEAFKRVISLCRPGMYEYELAAELNYFYQKKGASELAFPTIVGAGENTTVLHYDKYQSVLNDGDLVLLDAGCVFEHYPSDITRTIPVNGKFTKEQRAIYDLVLKMQLAGIDKLYPGNSCNDAHEAAVRVATEGLCELGLLKGNIDELIEKGAYKSFYMHKFSHWIGLDVHDPSRYGVEGDWRKLEVGMVLSAEPGIYIKSGLKGVDRRWWNIGVRIEDDVLITKKGPDILTAGLPKEVDEIERIMAKKP